MRRLGVRRPPGQGRRKQILVLVCLAVVVIAALEWRSVVSVARAARVTSHIRRVESYAEVIRFAAEESGLDPNLLAAIMLSESGGKVDAVSSAGALGLFQLQLGTAGDMARDMRLPEPTRDELLRESLLNARLAARYLVWLGERFDGDLEKMLIAYNAGPARLRAWIAEAGGYAAWRAERERAGNSDVLAYVAKVARMRERFAERGHIVPPAP